MSRHTIILEKLLKNFLIRFFLDISDSETQMRGHYINFDCVNLPYDKYHKINFKCAGLYLDFLDWIKNEKATINPKK